MGCTANKSGIDVVDVNNRSNRFKEAVLSNKQVLDVTTTTPPSTPATTSSSRSSSSNKAPREHENTHNYETSGRFEAERSSSRENVDGIQFSTPLTETSNKGPSKAFEQHIENEENPSIMLIRTPQSPEPLPQANNRVFQGVFVNQELLCRDEYISKHTKEQVYRWRKAKIIAIEGADNSRVQVHFIGWAVSFDRWLDLNKEWFKLAPVRLLSIAKCKAGDNLNDWQQDIVTQYLLAGKQTPSSHAMEEESTSPPSSTPIISGEEIVGSQPSSSSARPTVEVQDTHRMGGSLPMAETITLPNSTPPLPSSLEVVAVPTATGMASKMMPTPILTTGLYHHGSQKNLKQAYGLKHGDNYSTSSARQKQETWVWDDQNVAFPVSVTVQQPGLGQISTSAPTYHKSHLTTEAGGPSNSKVATTGNNTEPMCIGTPPDQILSGRENKKPMGTLETIHEMLNTSFSMIENEFNGNNKHQEQLHENDDEVRASNDVSKLVAKVWVVRYVDYTSKYGLGFLFNTGSTGVYFNDSTKIVLSADGMVFQYIERSSEHSSQTHLIKSYPSELQKKVTLLRHFRNYLIDQQKSNSSNRGNEDNCNAAENQMHDIATMNMYMNGNQGLSEGASTAVKFGTSSVRYLGGTIVPVDGGGSVMGCSSGDEEFDMPFLKKWMRTKHAILFRISNRTVQVVFYDRSEVLLSSEARIITFVSKQGYRTEHLLDDVLHSGRLDIAKRLKYTKDIIYRLISSQSKVEVQDTHRMGGSLPMVKGPVSNGSSSSSNGNSKIDSDRSGSVGNLHGVPIRSPTTASGKKGSSKSSEEPIENTRTIDSQVTFKGVYINQEWLCRDEFFSYNTIGMTYRWRKAKITAIECADNSRVKVHFISLANEADKWLDLRWEWFKLAPVGLLSDAECDEGVYLSDAQLNTVSQYLFVGERNRSPAMEEEEGDATGRPHLGAGASILYQPNINRASTRRLEEDNAHTGSARKNKAHGSNHRNVTNGRIGSKIERKGSLKNPPQIPEALRQDSSQGFQGVFVNQVLMCRDEFCSTSNIGKNFKWREAKIIAIEGEDNSRVKVHFISWADSFDIWLDLRKEWFKLAPHGLLSKAECEKGVPLSNSQQEHVTQFLFLGEQSLGHAMDGGATAGYGSQSSSSVATQTVNMNSTSTSTSTRPLVAGNAYTRRLESRRARAIDTGLPSHRCPFQPCGSELNNQRNEFWDTRTDGNLLMWQAIQSAADAVLSSDLRLANTILQASNITAPNGLLEVCFDERGHQYQVPLYCIANPLELVKDSQTDKLNSAPSELEDSAPHITVKVKINPGDYNMKVLVSSRGTILDLKKIVAKTASCEEDQQRIVYMGKELKNSQKVSEVGFEEAKVAQIFLRPQAK